MSHGVINLDPDHIGNLIFVVWTQEDVAQRELGELWATHQFFLETGVKGEAAPSTTCEDHGLPLGTPCDEAISAFLASIGQ